MSKEYTPDLQKLFLEMMMQDAQNYVRVQNIFNVENFDRSLKDAAEFIKSHCTNHTAMPTYEQLNAATGVNAKPIPDMADGHNDWFLEEFEGFTKRQELERAILKAADMLECFSCIGGISNPPFGGIAYSTLLPPFIYLALLILYLANIRIY